jgi:N-acetylneuraminate synthase
MKKMFTLPVGISDHTLGISVSLAAVSLGAVVVERHLTLSRKLSGPDSFFSLEPKELKELVDNTRIVEKALGEVRYGLTQSEKKSRIFRRSLFIVRDMKKGESFTHQNVRSIRPANGLAPKHLTRILGKKAIKDIRKGTPMSNAFIA